MKKTNFPKLVGVVHLPALPGAPRSELALEDIARRATVEARVLEDAGFDAVIVENFGDTPFFRSRVPAITVSAMTVVAHVVRQAVRIPIGANVLRNDGASALAIAVAAGLDFIRVNVLSGVAATDQGLIEGEAAELARARRALGARRIQIWGDALVKHARTLSADDVELAVEELAGRAGADAVIVTGATTGRAVDLGRLRKAAAAAHGAPVYLGSGVTERNLEQYAELAHGVIVGSALREHGVAGRPLERRRVRAFAKAFRDRQA